MIHFHAVLRIGGPGGPADPVPAWASATLRDTYLRNAARAVQIKLPATPANGRRRTLRFGTQLDTQAILTDDLVSEGMSARAIGFYVAKYATKASEIAVGPPRPIKSLHALEYLHLLAHTDRMIRACFQVAADFDDVDLTRYAHMLGYRGYCTTKSRMYSTTFGALRDTRRNYEDNARRERLGLPPLDSRQVRVDSKWTFLRAGLSYGEALLIKALRRPQRRLRTHSAVPAPDAADNDAV